MIFILRAWVWYWRLRYGIRTSVTGGGVLDPTVLILWTERDTDGTELTSFAEGLAADLLKVMPATTRLIAHNHRQRKGAAT